MLFAPSYISAVAIILAQIFPDIGVDAFNTTLNTLVTVGAAIFIGIRQVVNRRSTLAGLRP